MLLTDVLLLDYKRCPRRAFLNLYGNSQERDSERDFLLKLRQESQTHIEAVLAGFYSNYRTPETPFEDWQGRVQETEALMQQGVACIYQGMLGGSASLSGEREQIMGSTPLLARLLGTPHLLIRQPGVSRFGDWLYIPGSIQLGRRPKPEYKIVAAYYAQLLAATQGTLPPTAYLFLRPSQTRGGNSPVVAPPMPTPPLPRSPAPHLPRVCPVDLGEWLPRLQATLADCLEMLAQSQEPEVFISRQRCSLCHWYSHCYALAQAQQHLSLVPGVTPSRYQSLQTLGVADIQSLAAVCPVNLGEVIGGEVASQLQQQAQSLVENRAMRRVTRQIRSPSEIPTAAIELYFDIEAEPERNLDYLLGILLVDRQENRQQFYAFLAEKPEEEEQIWWQFLAFVNRYEQAPIFHFSEYEAETIQRLANLYRTPRRQFAPLLSRLVDLHHRVINSVTLPVESYSLKSLANWLGFKWRDVGVGGDQCVCWYDQWLKTGDRRFLELILRYNEDDCRATLHLKNWLINFLF